MKTRDSDLRPKWSENASQMRAISVLGHLTWDQKMRRGVMRRGEEWWVRFPGRAAAKETEGEEHYKTFLGSIEKSLHSPKFTVWFSAENCTVFIYKVWRTLVLFYTLLRCFPVFSVWSFDFRPSTLSYRELSLILQAGPCFSWGSSGICVALKY